jgi:DNA-binding SARP family transcriptional activator
MQPETNGTPRTEVNMMGEFSITINGNQLTNLTGRTKRVWLLIQYLIANRNKEISTQMLIKVLWEKNKCGDPLNSLKNLIYRARELLKEISKDQRSEFIEYSRNTYKWNNKYDCIVDTEQFVALWKLLKDSSQSDETRIQLGKEAIALYRGGFLPKSSYSTWAASSADYFSTLYNDCVLNTSSLLVESKCFDEVISICEDALTHTPLEESIHSMLLYSYINTNQRSKALDHYTQTAKLFYKELGVEMSDSLRAIYKQITSSVNYIEADLSMIKNDLREVPETQGAYYCDYDVFKAIYRAQARMMMRTGLSIFIILFTLYDLTDNSLNENTIQLISNRFKASILTSLRKGDIASSYSVTQFVVLLPATNYENAEMVSDRIIQKFEFLYRKKNVKVTTMVKPVDAVE